MSGCIFLEMECVRATWPCVLARFLLHMAPPNGIDGRLFVVVVCVREKIG